MWFSQLFNDMSLFNKPYLFVRFYIPGSGQISSSAMTKQTKRLDNPKMLFSIDFS